MSLEKESIAIFTGSIDPALLLTVCSSGHAAPRPALPVREFQMELLRLCAGPEPQKGTKPQEWPGIDGDGGRPGLAGGVSQALGGDSDASEKPRSWCEK